MELDDELNEDVRAEAILAKLEEAEKAEANPPQEPAKEAETPAEQVSAPEGDEKAGAVETPPTSEKEGQSEPETPAIAPPKFLQAEYRERWNQLPTDWQQYLVRQKEEDDKAVRTKFDEAASERHAAEAARKAAEEERVALTRQQQSYAQNLQQVISQVALIDPIIAEGQKTDWVKLARDNPAEWTQKRSLFDQRVQTVQSLVAEQQRAAQAAAQAHFAKEDAALLERIPEWKEPTQGQRGLQELKSNIAQRYGYNSSELQTIGDHRLVLLARDALAYHALKAEVSARQEKEAADKAAAKQAIAEKKVVKPAPKVQQPNAVPDAGDPKSDRSKAILKQARGTKSLSERAAILAEIL